MQNEIQRLLLAFLMPLLGIAMIAFYWAIIEPGRALNRDDNPRLFADRAAISRGLIVDRDDNPLVISIRDANNRIRREYLNPAMNSALGYYSLRYGVGGAEAAYDALLNGDDLATTIQTYIQQDLLHQPQAGADIRLTLDSEVQNTLMTLMDGRTGAAVVLSVPDGDVLGMISLPTYDPNTLDSTWDTLIDDPGNPFFNRVLQANYQPGGMMYTLLLITALVENISLDTRYEDADQPLIFDDITLTCTTQPPQTDLTLLEAYIYGCPAPFAAMIETLGITELTDTFQLFQLDNPVTLAGFVPPTPANPQMDADATLTLLDVLGQGEITFTPLQMASVMTSVINIGNALEPYALLATHPPNATEWQLAHPTPRTRPITTANTSRTLQNALRQAQLERESTVDIGGQAALAFSGEETLVWFAGFARIERQDGVVVVVVLENSDDLEEATRIGRHVLETAAEAR